MAMKRPHGGEQPCIRLGIFQIRIPFIHANFSVPDIFQAFANSVMCFGAVATVMQVLGVSEESAYAAAVLSAMLYIPHQLAGDPIVCGWITPAIPLVTMFCLGYPEDQRIQAMCALQFMLAFIFLFLGITGLAKKVVALVPPSIKGGVILGAAFTAIYGEFKDGGRFSTAPLTILIGLIVWIFVAYSPVFKEMAAKNKLAKTISNLGLVPPVVVALVVGIVSKEVSVNFQLFPIFDLPDFGLMFRELSPFSVGFPKLTMFLSAFPTAIAVYIVAFGDLLVVQGIVDESNAARDDEFITCNINRLSITTGLRNLVFAFVAPFPPTNGPLGAPFSIACHQGYKDRGPESMYSIHGGIMSHTWFPWIGMLFTPLVSLCRPIAAPAMTLALTAQGFTCTQIGVEHCRDKVDLAIAGAIAGLMAAQGAAWGLGAGIITYVIMVSSKKRKEDFAYNRAEILAKDEAERKAREMTANAAK